MSDVLCGGREVSIGTNIADDGSTQSNYTASQIMKVGGHERIGG